MVVRQVQRFLQISIYPLKTLRERSLLFTGVAALVVHLQEYLVGDTQYEDGQVIAGIIPLKVHHGAPYAAG